MAPIRFFTIFITSIFVILWTSSINGENAEAGAYPSLAAIKWTANNIWRCTGHIISPSWILTTALCIHNIEETELHIQYGINRISFYANIVNISKLITHTNYNAKKDENDIALIKLEKDLDFSYRAQPAKLPMNNYIPSADRICKSVGWFDEENKKTISELQVFNAAIMSHIDCSEIRNEKIKYTEFCTQHPVGRDDCTSGSGSGLFFDDYLYGLAIKGASPCKATDQPSVYIKINSYYNWIFESIIKYELENFLKSPELITSGMLRSFYTKLQSELPEVYRTSYGIIDL